MTQPCKTCPTPNACEIGNLCAYRDMEVIERAMARMDAMRQSEVRTQVAYKIIDGVIIAAVIAWLVVLIVRTGV